MLRITSGEFRNRRINVPPTDLIRPMLEKARMAVFSILGQDVAQDQIVIDCFAGSGVLGLEALSRGASHAIFFDIEKKHVDAINELSKQWGCENRCLLHTKNVLRTLMPGSLFRMPNEQPARLIFIDPPHSLVKEEPVKFYEWFKNLGESEFVDKNSLAVLGHHAKEDTPESLDNWVRFDIRKYGKVALSLYKRPS